ncbi:thioredoxin domain-containing protein [Pelobacter propionicus]|uniref:Spermatogenesis-associated protein 20-like TRX domain-containing protein n=1 Tax=Pelobacter propionicus (strain DSM 2379 / NBRC 103807 / OttBd1) TaxID=338966 RepID=A1AMQ5_PELPD|nr:thioredoxin domain-containing protein [Pelobacter propionicus]ABK98625.1 protein of unknown function DUF255 [Pelobacter propionicus DSM 2379]
MQDVSREKDENSWIRSLWALEKGRLPADGGAVFNRLIFAASPYLLQHADNPVDWYPWGEEAFETAAREDKPLMVSIGYATCHWCHVMARESFEDPEVAAIINRHLIPVKVDREERPDIDSLYMTAARILTGSGAGWPLTIFLTPERKPFYCATYIPKTGSNGVLGIVETVEKISEIWNTNRDLINENSDTVVRALREIVAPVSADTDFGRVLDEAQASLQGMYDYLNGGFGGGAKFPLPHNLSFLLRMWRRTQNQDIEEMVAYTLRMMRDGGIYDQLGFGFHRYAVDPEWRVPHFEKMLYDQALIAITCLEAFQAYGDEFLKDMAMEIFSFVFDELTSPDGGFCSGLGADSGGGEGYYYLWSRGEIDRNLDGETSRLFCEAFGVTDTGNFEGGNILYQPRSVALLARENGLDAGELDRRLETARAKLLEVRAERVRPFRDEKILVAWNGLMVAALARGAAVSGEQRLLEAARSAVRFIARNLHTPAGRLLRSYHQSVASVPAFLEDYAFLCWGMVELYQVDGDPVMLQGALGLARGMLDLFSDAVTGAFYDTASEAEQVLVRMKNAHDGAIPSGNSIACLCLLKLGKICGDEALTHAGERCLVSWMGSLAEQPIAHIQMVTALDFFLGPDVEITLIGDRDKPGVRELLNVIHRYFIPGLVLRFKGDGDVYPMVGGLPTAYVCARGACRPPVNDAAQLEQLLSEIV